MKLRLIGLKKTSVCPHICVSTGNYVLLWRKGTLQKTVSRLKAAAIFLVVPQLRRNKKRTQTMEIAALAQKMPTLHIFVFTQFPSRYTFPPNVKACQQKRITPKLDLHTLPFARWLDAFLLSHVSDGPKMLVTKEPLQDPSQWGKTILWEKI